MNFPRWVRSEIVLPAPPDAELDEIRCKVVRALEQRGTTGIEMRAGRAQFRAERAIFNLNPLTPCRAGSFEVERVPQGIRVRYQLDLFYLLIWTAVAAAFAGVISLISLAAGSYSTTILFIGFFAAAIPLTYAFYGWRAKALFRAAATA